MMKSMKIAGITLALVAAFSLPSVALATDYPSDQAVPGLSGIQPGDTLEMPENTEWATLTASWGLRVTFVDAAGNVLQDEVIPVDEDNMVNVKVPSAPELDGATFAGWKLGEDSDAVVTMNEDGSADIKGPGPVILTADYEPIVSPDPTEDPKNDPKSKGGLPITGDSAPLAALAVLFAACGVVLARRAYVK